MVSLSPRSQPGSRALGDLRQVTEPPWLSVAELNEMKHKRPVVQGPTHRKLSQMGAITVAAAALVDVQTDHVTPPEKSSADV